MKLKYLIAFLLVLLMAGVVSAATENVSAGMSVTGKGPYDILVSLGIENFVPIAQARLLYNWISILGIVSIAALASSRTTRFFGILVPLFSAMFMYFGWFTMNDPASPGKLWGVVVVASVLAAAVYMKGSLHERFGIAGPGTMLFNVVFFMIILQATVGFVNATSIWNGAQAAVTPTTEYTNIDLKSEMTSVNAGAGAVDTITSTATILLDMAIGCVKMFVAMAMALAAFSVVVGMTYPWIPASLYGAGVLILLQVGIYLMYYMAAIQFFRNSNIGSDF